jgi:hypothetical protein
MSLPNKDGGNCAPKLKTFAFAAGLATMTIWGSAARAEILHAYLLVERKNIDDTRSEPTSPISACANT